MGMSTKERVPQPSPRSRLSWRLRGQRGRCRGPARGLRRGGGDEACGSRPHTMVLTVVGWRGRRPRPRLQLSTIRRGTRGTTPLTPFAPAPLSFCFSSRRTWQHSCSCCLPAPAPLLLLASHAAPPFPLTSHVALFPLPLLASAASASAPRPRAALLLLASHMAKCPLTLVAGVDATLAPSAPRRAARVAPFPLTQLARAGTALSPRPCVVASRHRSQVTPLSTIVHAQNSRSSCLPAPLPLTLLVSYAALPLPLALSSCAAPS